MAKDAVLANNRDETVRRIYVLSRSLVARIKRHQAEHGYPSEVEAVRAILEEALNPTDQIVATFEQSSDHEKRAMFLSALNGERPVSEAE